MRKILYITFANKEIATGGGQCSGRNLQSLHDIFGSGFITEYIIRPIDSKRTLGEYLSRMTGIVKGYMGGLTDVHLHSIINIICKGDITDVFIDSSQLGILARRIKKINKNIRIYTFFHNVEYDYMRSVTIESGDYAHCFWMYGAWRNEHDACKFSDSKIVLNADDSNRLHQLYGCDIDAIVPITMRDNYHDLKECDYIATNTGTKEALFLGSYFPGNIKGLKWFCDEVLPFVDIHLTIVGAGMDAFANDVNLNDKISLYSYVEDLSSFYEKADFVVLPIISGGGMKVKTAESMKYGKFMIGTNEAFAGYEISDDIATVCSNKNDFIDAIESFDCKYKYNIEARNLFKEKYSYENSLMLFKKILEA